MMYRAFDKISIIKPVTSRPANSEKYIICCGKRDRTSHPIEHILFDLNYLILEEWIEDGTDIIEIVPVSLMLSDQNFANFVRKSNEKIGQKQIDGLQRIKEFIGNPTTARSPASRNQAEMFGSLESAGQVSSCT